MALIASIITERRQTTVRQRISQNIGNYVAPLGTAPSSPRLERSAQKTGTMAGWVPADLQQRLDLALGATGDKIKFPHLLLCGCVGALLAYGVVGILLGFGPAMSLPLMAAAAFLLPYGVLRFMQAKFQSLFLTAFPDALDLIVRAVRAGLPVTDAIETVGYEIGGPVGAEFRRVHEGVSIGLDLEQELTRAATRIRSVEFRFFIVTLNLQRRTGGNLAETLENLSLTIRRRKEMWAKARALMSEARASGWLIGALPFVGGGAIYFINPVYMGMLFNDPRGKMLLGIAILLLAGGAYVMRSMIKRSME
jgi:tight adherence protein B